MPRLAAVHYRLFEHEQQAIDAAHIAETHDFGGELALTFHDGLRSFISWTSEPVQYAVGIGGRSHFRPDASLADYDVSHSRMWVGLIGKEIKMEYSAADDQILRIASADDHVLVCSLERGNWWADELTICKQAPAPYPE